MTEKTYANLLLSKQRALLGEVTPTLRGVAVKMENDDIIVYFYNDGPISEELEDDYSCVGTEIISDFCSGIISEEIIRWDLPKRLPSHDFWAYRLKEDKRLQTPLIAE